MFAGRKRGVEELEPSSDGGSVTEKTARRQVSHLAKAIETNTSMRAMHSDDPHRFLPSESALDDAINAILPLATAPDLYPTLIDANFHEVIVPVLAHENDDIVADVVRLLSEMTDEESVRDLGDGESVSVLVRALCEADVVAMVLALIRRLASNKHDQNGNEKSGDENVKRDLSGENDGDIAVHAFALLDAVLTVLPPEQPPQPQSQVNYADIVKTLLEVADLFPDAVELLATVCLYPTGRAHFVHLSGATEWCLKRLSSWRRKDPVDADEEELMENIVGILCSVLNDGGLVEQDNDKIDPYDPGWFPRGRQQFIDLEGVELMVILLKYPIVISCPLTKCRNKLLSSTRALKILSFATSGLHHSQLTQHMCQRLVEAGGLAHLFNLFSKKHVKKMKKLYNASFSSHESLEHTISILASLFRHLTSDPPHFYLDRLLQRFSDDDKSEPLQQLCHLHREYTRKLLQQPTDADAEDVLALYVPLWSVDVMLAVLRHHGKVPLRVSEAQSADDDGNGLTEEEVSDVYGNLDNYIKTLEDADGRSDGLQWERVRCLRLLSAK